MKNRLLTSLCQLLGIYLKYSWISFCKLSMSAFNVRFYRQQLLLEVSVGMRLS